MLPPSDAPEHDAVLARGTEGVGTTGGSQELQH